MDIPNHIKEQPNFKFRLAYEEFLINKKQI